MLRNQTPGLPPSTEGLCPAGPKPEKLPPTGDSCPGQTPAGHLPTGPSAQKPDPPIDPTDPLPESNYASNLPALGERPPRTPPQPAALPLQLPPPPLPLPPSRLRLRDANRAVPPGWLRLSRGVLSRPASAGLPPPLQSGSTPSPAHWPPPHPLLLDQRLVQLKPALIPLPTDSPKTHWFPKPTLERGLAWVAYAPRSD